MAQPSMASTNQVPLLYSKLSIFCHLEKSDVEITAGLYLQVNCWQYSPLQKLCGLPLHSSGEFDYVFSCYHNQKTSLGNAQYTVGLDSVIEILVVKRPSLQNCVHCSLLQFIFKS